MHLLAYLRDLVRFDGGYELLGVRGWATAQKVEAATAAHSVLESLHRAYRRGELLREDVSAPDGPKPVWVFRITADIALKMAALEAAEYVPVQPCTVKMKELRVLMKGSAVAAMAAMHYARKALARRPRIEGEPEWRTSRELSMWLDDESQRTGTLRHFQSDDLNWLVKHGLAERRSMRRDPHSSFKRRAILVYRLSVTGAATKPLAWHEPKTPIGENG